LKYENLKQSKARSEEFQVESLDELNSNVTRKKCMWLYLWH